MNQVSFQFHLIPLLSLLWVSSGCFMGTKHQLNASRHQALRLSQQNEQLQQENQMANSQLFNQEQIISSFLDENEKLQKELAQANEKLAQYAVTQQELQTRYKNLLISQNQQGNPLPNSAIRRFERLAEQYPEFEFDPQTGVSKFHSDVLFSSGSAQIRSGALPLLQQFAAIMQDGEARNLNILVVGHTDDQAIRQNVVQTAHPTNWHLSTNRANSVVMQLNEFGLSGGRMGSAGYGMFQPIVVNANEQSRQLNRRVEIFVLAPDAVIAGWDPHMVR